MYFTEEHELFRQGFKDFLQKEVCPHINDWEKTGKIDRDVWKKFGEMGYFGIHYPEKYGGLGLDIFYTVIFLEELQKVNSGGFAAAMWAHAYLAMSHLNHEASESIKEKYLRSSIEGTLIGCLCITEPYCGSDVAAMKTTAIRKGDKFIINGSKTFITNGVYSDYLIVSAKTKVGAKSKGISIFLVDRNAKGISATKLDKLGWRASDTGEIAFDNVEIDSSQLLGIENRGFPYLMHHLAFERLLMAINAHARAEYAIEYTINYMSERMAFGKKLSEFQALRHRLAEHISKVEIQKSYNYKVSNMLQNGAYVVKEASMSKLMSTDIADKAIYDCLQFLGGYGYMEEYPLARLWRDSRLGPIGGGTSEILKEIIARMVIDNKDYNPSK